MAIKGFTRGDSGGKKPPQTKVKGIASNPNDRFGPVSPPIKQKAVPQPYSQAPGGSAGQANSITAWQAANPASVRTPGIPTSVPDPTAMGGAGADFGYTPTGLGQLYQNPVPLAQDVLGGMGIDNFGMAQLLADAFNPALYARMIMSKGMGDQSDQAVIDYIANYLQQATTPGGAMPEFDDMMRRLLSAGDPNSSPLAADLSSLTPEDQVKTMQAYMQAAGFGNNPLAQRAYDRAGDYFGTQYLGETMKGDPSASSYAQFLKGSPLSRWY